MHLEEEWKQLRGKAEPTLEEGSLQLPLSEPTYDSEARIECSLFPRLLTLGVARKGPGRSSRTQMVLTGDSAP